MNDPQVARPGSSSSSDIPGLSSLIDQKHATRMPIVDRIALIIIASVISFIVAALWYVLQEVQGLKTQQVSDKVLTEALKAEIDKLSTFGSLPVQRTEVLATEVSSRLGKLEELIINGPLMTKADNARVMQLIAALTHRLGLIELKFVMLASEFEEVHGKRTKSRLVAELIESSRLETGEVPFTPEWLEHEQRQLEETKRQQGLAEERLKTLTDAAAEAKRLKDEKKRKAKSPTPKSKSNP